MGAVGSYLSAGTNACYTVTEKVSEKACTYQHTVLYENGSEGRMGKIWLNSMKHGNMTMIRETLLFEFGLVDLEDYVFKLKYTSIEPKDGGALFEPLEGTQLSDLIRDKNIRFVFTYKPRT